MDLRNTVIDGRYYLGEQLGAGGMSLIFKATDRLTNQAVAFKILKAEITSSHIEDIIRFKREIEVVTKLNHPNIIKLYSCGEFDNKPYLVMEFLTGGNLRDLLHHGQQFKFQDTVAIIKQITEALIYVHHHGVIHRDLKPGNIFIEKEAGHIKVKLLDFGTAFVMELGAVKGAAQVIGTFGYMSPEATGILNNRLDERSDLYSLGVVFYHLLTNELPFQGDNVNQIIHRQVALTPPRPIIQNPDIPAVLEAIVLKLLQKDPDLRYQSARGLWADLERYQNGEWQFEIGAQDQKVKLTYQTRLVGRETELERIKELINQTKTGHGGICLVAGEAGIGKSKFIEEIRSLIYEMDELSISGRCINCQNKTPYQPFKDAIDDYLVKLEKEENDNQYEVVNRLRNQWPTLDEIIIQFNPRLKKFLGTPAPLEMEWGNQRFLTVVADFICSLASPGKICVLSLDDLQWADEGSFNLLLELLPKIHNSNLFILGTYRDNEVDQNHGLERLKRQSKEAGSVLSEIHLATLPYEQLNKLIANLLGETEAQARKLSKYILDNSGGNPFFAIQIVRELIEKKAISWKKGGWEEEWEVLSQAPVSGSMLDIILRRIEKLNPDQKTLLSIGAVIGREFEIELMYHLTDLSKTTVVALIDEAIALQLLERSLSREKILFVHDRIRDAFYQRITETKRQEIHLQIARAIETLHDNLDDEVIYDLGRHYAEGGDQEKTLQYMLPAAAQAKRSWANEDAIKFYKIAINILENKKLQNSDWLEAKENLIQLYITVGKLEEARTISEQVLPFVSDTLVKARIYKKIAQTYGAKDWNKCKKNSIKGLELLGVKIPNHNFEINIFLMVELAKHLLNRMFPGLFYRITPQPMSEKYKEIVLLCSNLMWMYIRDEAKKLPWITLRMLNLSERKIGKSFELGMSLVAYAEVCMGIPFVKRALKYSHKALSLFQEQNNEFGVSHNLNCLAFYFFLAGKNDESIKHNQQAKIIYQKLGDIGQLGFALIGLGRVYYYISDYTQSIMCLEQYLEISRKYQDPPGIYKSLVFLSACYIEKGDLQKAQDFLAEIQNLSPEGRLESHEALYFNGYLELERKNYRDAIVILEQIIKVTQVNRFFKRDVVNLFSSLADARIQWFKEIHPNMNPWTSKQELKRLFHFCLEAIRETKPWPNHYGGALRAMANFYQLAGKNITAEKYFLKSMVSDQKVNRRFELAKDYFEYGNFLESLHKTTKASEQWHKAYEIFKDIGATGYTQKTILLLEGTPGNARGRMQSQFSNELTAREHLKTQKRMNTISSTSRYISSILDIEDLLQKILDSTIELTGAERGILLLYPEEGERQLEIKATCKISKEEFQRKGFTSSRSIITRVETEKISLIYMDAMAEHELRTQSSVVSNGGRSTLCAPIINKGKMLGIIYLDNTFVASLFTENDLNTLSLISNQAGISIENARLYSKLKNYSKEIEESQAEITKWNQELEQCVQERTNELSEKNTKLETMNQELLTKNQQLQEYSATVAELAIAEERNRLAHDLHDSLGQLMALSISQLGACGDLCLKSPLVAQEELEKIVKLLRKGLSEVRHSITGLIPEKLKGNNLVDTLQSLIMDYQASGLKVDFSVEGKVDVLELQLSDTVYHTCQEALTNSLKHGQAKEVMILLRFSGDYLKIYISDDGCGCKIFKPGLGLTGMEQRVRSLHGELNLGSDGESGFNLRIEIPLAPKRVRPMAGAPDHQNNLW
ncbi:MAG TPA: protein kinase [Bacillota bacterium]|nr:protein kinase [Bacillota bacterium]